MRTGKTSRNDPFFSQQSCDRCGGNLQSRTMSWFNKDTICMPCSEQEKKIKNILRAKGVPDAMEGCGFIPIQGKDY